MQEAYYLPVSPEDNECWEIQREDKFLIEADQTNEFDFRGNDFSSPNVLRVSVIQKTPQKRIKVGDGIKDDDDDDDDNYNVVVENDNGLDDNDEVSDDSDVDNKGPHRMEDDDDGAITCDAMQIGHDEHLSESIWNDYTTPEVTSLVENNLENVINQELIATTAADMVHDELTQPEQGTTVMEATESDKITILQTIGFNLSAKDFNNHVLSHLSADYSSPQHLTLLPQNTWYDHSVPVDCEVEETTVPVETEEEGSPVKTTEQIPHAAPSFRDTANTSSFVPLLVSLPPPPLSPQKNELPTVKRVKTNDLPAADSSNSTEEMLEQQFESTIVSDNKEGNGGGIESVQKETNESMVPFVHDDEEEKCKIKIQCPKCKEQFKFAEEAEIDAHIKRHIPTTYYKCGFCDTTVTDKNEFNEHMKNHTTVVESNSGNKFPYKCSYCENLAFKTIEELTSHIEMHVPRNIFVCPKCSAQFVRENKKRDVRIRPALKKDAIATTTGTINKLRTTPVLTPADKATMRDNFKCTTCTAIFRRQDDFNKHVKTHIMPDTKQQVSDVKVDPSYCAYCSSELLSIAEIIVHIRKHTEERKQTPCSNCDKKTTSDRSNSSNGNNRGKENLCNYCLNFRVSS